MQEIGGVYFLASHDVDMVTGPAALWLMLACLQFSELHTAALVAIVQT